MPHIHTNPGEHDFTVSAFIVRYSPEHEQWRVLLHLHKKLGKLLQFGGHVELHETPWQALSHEIKEESGYDISDLQLFLSTTALGLSDCDEQPVPFSLSTHRFGNNSDHFHTDLAYAFKATAEPLKDIGNEESNDLRWLTERELTEIPPELIPSNVRELALFVLKHAK